MGLFLSPWVAYFMEDWHLRTILRVTGKILLGMAIFVGGFYVIFYLYPLLFLAAFLLIFYSMGACWFQ